MPRPTTKKAQSNKSNSKDKQDLQDLFADTNITMKSGRLTKDAVTISDDKFAKLRIAGNKQYLNNRGEVATLTNYFNVLISKKLEKVYELAKSLKKGDWVYVKGEDATQSFDTPEGYKQTASTIFAYKLVLKQPKDENLNDIKSITPAPVLNTK